MTDNLTETITNAFQYLDNQGVPVPTDLYIRAYNVGAIKATGDSLESVNAKYHDDITEALIGYFEGDSLAVSRNAFKRSTTQSFVKAFDLGWFDGGRELPIDRDVLEWFNARIETEFGYISMLFQEAKELRGDEEFDFFAWITQRADGYVRTLKELYNAAKMRALKDQMVTFDGDDGEESCDDCQKLKGKRHRISWFVKRNYVPPFGTGLACHRGRRCQHGLFTDDGEQLTA